MLPVPRHQPDKKRRDDTKKVYDKLRRWYGIPHATKVKLLLTIASDFKISKNKIIIDPKFGADKQVTVVLEPLADHIRGEIGFEIDLFCPPPGRPAGHHAKKEYDQKRRDKLNTLFLEIKREIQQRMPRLKRSPSKWEALHYLINRFSGEKCEHCEAIQVQSTKEKDKIKDIEERTTNNCLWDRLERAILRKFEVPQEKRTHEKFLEVALTSLRLLQHPKREVQAISADEIEEVEAEIGRDDSEEEYEDFSHNHHQRAPRGIERLQDEPLVEVNYNNRHVMEDDMESIEEEYREPAFPRNDLVDNGYEMRIYAGDEMEVDHVEEIETAIERMEDEPLVDHKSNNIYAMKTDMGEPYSFEGACREPAFLRNGLFDNGYGMSIYQRDEMGVDHVEEIEATIVAKEVVKIPDVIDEDEIKKESEGIDEEIGENDQKRNIGSDEAEQNNLVEIKNEFMEEVEEIEMKVDEIEASEGPSHIDKMEEVEMEEEVKVGIEEKAIEDLGNEIEVVVQNFEEEEMEQVGEPDEDKEEHSGKALREELTIAVQAVIRDKEWNKTTINPFKKYLGTISNLGDKIEIFNATAKMLRTAEKTRNTREFALEVPFVEILQKRGLCCGNFVEKEELVKCDQCEHFYHETCREMGWAPMGACECRRPEFLRTKYTSSLLPTNRMSEELTKAIPEAYKNQVEVRVVANEVRNGTIGERLAAFCEKNNIAVPQHKYHYKMILVFLKPVEGQDEEKGEALIFAYTVHEFGAGEEAAQKSKWTVLGYLDSNRYITDGTKRHLIFQGIVLSYFKYAASAGYEFCHFWCAAPGNEYYLFNDPMMKEGLRLDQIRLLEWYKNILNHGKTSGIIEKWECKSEDSKGMSLQDLLGKFYLDGGYWPKRIEKFLEKEVKPEKLREQMVKEISNDSDAFFIDFCALKTAVIQDSTPIIPTMDMTRSKEDFLAVQIQNGLRYSTNRLLWYSTARTIQLLMKGFEHNGKQEALPSS
ncbi:hypothetical protein B9Z55_022423 [Caenorhabditis nigoni]|uniref:histone acetyltransferase n=1 Tax=Caenorhabditis nigoni TaxID=1611254 RepID=A0A2G5SKR4_9PELO|nr:hypothetical protein B9Z55_022423 [Caenorhabditis nigoni]